MTKKLELLWYLQTQKDRLCALRGAEVSEEKLRPLVEEIERVEAAVEASI